MTDEEVKKGLECCAESSCSKRNDCPYKSKMPKNDGYIFCQQRKDKDALALINRLEQEKEQIRKETAKEILQAIADNNKALGIDDCFLCELTEEFGVEVDE